MSGAICPSIFGASPLAMAPVAVHVNQRNGSLVTTTFLAWPQSTHVTEPLSWLERWSGFSCKLHWDPRPPPPLLPTDRNFV